LHWISWDKPGAVEIVPDSAEWYVIRGEQTNASNDYITIYGRLKRYDENSLLFRGEIKYQVSTINNGEQCVKEGEKIFKTTKNRKYWRLQDMLSCEGGTTDYVDIYF
jgi:hypothetical protein